MKQEEVHFRKTRDYLGKHGLDISEEKDPFDVLCNCDLARRKLFRERPDDRRIIGEIISTIETKAQNEFIRNGYVG